MERAVFFVDGNNWYHGCRALGVRRLAHLSFARVSSKLAQDRSWLATRYYVGRVPPEGDVQLHHAQERFLSRIAAQDRRISVHLGRLERRVVTNQAAVDLRRYLSSLDVRIDPTVRKQLLAITEQHVQTAVMVEKAVDVQLAVDMVVMAERREYDTAYLLSADGDLSPAVHAAMDVGRRVIVVSPSTGARLREVATTFIRLRRPWFDGLFDPSRPNEP